MLSAVVGALVAGVFALAAGIGATAWQLKQYREQWKEAEKRDRKYRRLSIISDLVAYRFVLTSKPADSSSLSAFNSALNRIPVEFNENIEVIEAYRRIGQSFSAEKFQYLINILKNDVLSDGTYFDVNLLENVPSAPHAPELKIIS